MLSFPSNAWFNEECKAHLKLFKLTKVTKRKGLNVVQILKNNVWRKKRRHFQLQERKICKCLNTNPSKHDTT